MNRAIPPAVFFFLTAIAGAEPLLPVSTGTTWEYRMIQENGAETVSADQTDSSVGAAVAIIERIEGTQVFEGKTLFKLVRRQAGVLLSTDLITVDEQGIIIYARAGSDGRAFAVTPPEKILAAPLRVGTSWADRTEAAGLAFKGMCEVTAEEDVQVLAGKFHAYRIHFGPTSAVSGSINRWFVPGIGFIKQVTTARAPTGALLQRTSLELRKLPTVIQDAKTVLSSKKISIEIASTPEGAAASSFSPVVASLSARWISNGLRPDAKLRAEWIAEEVAGIAPPDYKVDEAATIVTEPSSHGIFTLGRPESGWAEGKYRLDVYVDGALLDSTHVSIRK